MWAPLFPHPSEEGEYFLKVLIPSYAAGSIIGKGGQTIVQLQKETGATIKLSKSKDFYPGRRSHSVTNDITVGKPFTHMGSAAYRPRGQRLEDDGHAVLLCLFERP